MVKDFQAEEEEKYFEDKILKFRETEVDEIKWPSTKHLLFLY